MEENFISQNSAGSVIPPNTENIVITLSKPQRELQTRKVYYFSCEKCGHAHRQTFKKNKALIGLCRICRRIALTIHKDQASLFPNSMNYENGNTAQTESTPIVS